MGSAFLTSSFPLLQMKYANSDKANVRVLKVSPKSQLPLVGRERIFSISIKAHKTYRKVQKACVTVLLKFIHIMTALLVF